MENMALTVFSIFMQAAIGIMVFVAIAGLVNKDSLFKTAVFTSACLAIIGLLASLLHLGRPLAALNSLSNFGTSWLSREIWSTALVTGLTVLAALLIYFKPSAKGAVKIVIPLAAVIGLVDIYVMASIYTSSNVPAWQHGSIVLEFFTAAILMGAVLFLALSWKEAGKVAKVAAITAGAAMILQIVALVIYYIDLGASQSAAAHQSLHLLAGMSGVVIPQWLLNLLGVAMLLFPVYYANVSMASGQAAIEAAATSENTVRNSFAIAAALLVAGQIFTRYLFYAIMVVTTVGLV